MSDTNTELEKCLLTIIQDYSTFLKVRERENEEVVEEINNMAQMHSFMQIFIEDIMGKTQEEMVELFHEWFEEQDREILSERAKKRWSETETEDEEDASDSEPEVKFYTIEDIMRNSKNKPNEN
ncbi:MAG TPA: hypothetical protein DCG52_05020 [Alphaproteobacteria bacterium]|nr:hypothetical protein [Alphaproteobacteria bacterium]